MQLHSPGEQAERHDAISKHVGSSVTARCCSLHEPATVSGEQSHFGVVAAPLQSLHFCVTVFVHAEVIAHALATSLTPTVVGDSSDELHPTPATATATMNALATSALPGENIDDDDETICFTIKSFSLYCLTFALQTPDVRTARLPREARRAWLITRSPERDSGGSSAISQSCR